ncbi:TPA: erythromycin resistance leader peptide, partial [Staphylococcus aureus]|nr:erythromycin resistance leader peptide [Staphylococcus aureus]
MGIFSIFVISTVHYQPNKKNEKNIKHSQNFIT